ncbi:DUF4230 domain-containing protein [Novosphingobium sp. PC22D]|uniref:DUF4230 domain-containing protein n=1 Tax=Novosphingobium sp. PC22D TaxID=1962403 RepID=UPI0014397FF1|nr:DUF4230 domain-containing protein [Novosphingobium sp. PC22D]
MRAVNIIVVAVAVAISALILTPDAARQWLREKLTGDPSETAEAEILEGFEKLNRLVVYRAYITAISDKTGPGWVFNSRQVLITPAYVNYFVDLDGLDGSAITMNAGNAGSRTMTITLPPLMLERPNVDAANMLIVSEGILTKFSSSTEALRKANTKSAMRQLKAKARQSFLVKQAREQAIVAVGGFAEKILRQSDIADVNIVVRFKGG